MHQGSPVASDALHGPLVAPEVGGSCMVAIHPFHQVQERVTSLGFIPGSVSRTEPAITGSADALVA